MKRTLLICFALLFAHVLHAQETFPVNGTYDIRPGQYAFTNATIVINADQTITNGILLIKDRKIEAAGAGLAIPKGYVVIDLKGKYIYPSFIDLYSDYGLPATRTERKSAPGPQMESNIKGAFGWNQAIRSNVESYKQFTHNAEKADELK